MRSSDSPEPLDLERDLPTTVEDIAALRRLRNRPRLSLEEYLAFLRSLGSPPASGLRSRKGPRGDRPFDLLA